MQKVRQLHQISIKLCQEDQKQQEKPTTSNALYHVAVNSLRVDRGFFFP